MLLFNRSAQRWWQKPLVRSDERDLPAELVILRQQLRQGEAGAWLNSRGKQTGVVDLVPDSAGNLRTVRVALPLYVRELLATLYTAADVAKGAPDLVIWNDANLSVRFVEVKCPDWDRPSRSQLRFHQAARDHGCDVTIQEWRFSSDSPPAA